MTQSFRVGERVVWNRALAVTRLYARMAEAVAPLVERPTGIGEEWADYYQIDPPVFESFVEALIQRFEEATHPDLRGMIGGFVATSVTILENVGTTLPLTDPELIQLRAALR